MNDKVVRININYIEDLDLLRCIKQNTTYEICLCNNLDFNDYHSYNNINNYTYLLKNRKEYRIAYEGFLPIKINNSIVYFEGNGNTIRNLYINRKNEDNVGFLTCDTMSKIYISNLNFSSCFVRGKDNAGIISGLFNGSMKNINVEGIVIGKNNVGALSGISTRYLSISNCKIEASILGSNNVGYMIGKANIFHANSYSFDGKLFNENEEEIEEKEFGNSNQFNNEKIIYLNNFKRHI